MAALFASIATAAASTTPLGWASMGLGALGAIQGAVEARNQAKVESAVARNNAQIAEVQAQNTEAEANRAQASASRNAAELARQARLRRSAAIAAGAASGGTGYESELTDIDQVGEFNVLSAMFEGNQVAAGLTAEAAGIRQQADNFRYEGDMARRRGRSAATASLLGGVTSIAARLDKAGGATRKTTPRVNYPLTTVDPGFTR